MSDEHCWHMRSAQALPGKKRRSLWGDECCFCGAKRMRTTHARRDVKHGDRFDVWEQVTEDEEVTGAIKVQIEVDTSKLTRRASLELGDDETVAEFIRRVSQEIEDLTP